MVLLSCQFTITVGKSGDAAPAASGHNFYMHAYQLTGQHSPLRRAP